MNRQEVISELKRMACQDLQDTGWFDEVFIIVRDGKSTIIPGNEQSMSDEDTKFKFYSLISDLCEMMGPDFVGHAADSWFGTPSFDGPPREDPNRTEALVLSIIEPNGRCLRLVVPYKKKIMLEETNAADRVATLLRTSPDVPIPHGRQYTFDVERTFSDMAQFTLRPWQRCCNKALHQDHASV